MKTQKNYFGIAYFTENYPGNARNQIIHPEHENVSK